MKLLNRSLVYLIIAIFIILSVWAVIFYFTLRSEIRDSIDDGLDNNRLLIIQKINTDPSLLQQENFSGNNFEIHLLSKQNALNFKDVYKDTLMYRHNENDLEPVRILHTAFKHNQHYYHLKIISSLVEEDDLAESAFWGLLWVYFALIMSIALINNVLLRKIWTPFYSILNRLKNYRLEKNETPINVATTTKEFKELQKASNILINHSKKSFHSQKQFTENASHELQTPLAIITNKLELLLESDDLTDKDATSIAEVLQIAERLTRLNKSLLLLAKIENKQYDKEETVLLNELAKEFIGNFQEFIDFNEVAVSISDDTPLEVIMDKMLANILVANLIKNAVFHNKKKGRVTIHFTKTSFTICNTGKAFGLHPETIFIRFQKDIDKNQSTGLGLAVCKAICNYYGFAISYQFQNNLHCFCVDFKEE